MKIQKQKNGYIITKTEKYKVNFKHPNRQNIDIYNIRLGRKNGIIENIVLGNFSLMEVDNTNIREFMRIKKVVDIEYIKKFIQKLDNKNSDNIIEDINEIIELYSRNYKRGLIYGQD